MKKFNKEEMKKLFIEFEKREGRLPSNKSEDEKERSLAGWFYNLKKNNLEIYNYIVSLPNISSHLRKNKKEENKKLFIEFVERERIFPSQRSKDEKERSLAMWFCNLKSRDLEIYNSIVSLPNIASYLNKKKFKKEENKKLFIEFIEREERLPSQLSKDKKEKYLIRWFYNLKKDNLETYNSIVSLPNIAFHLNKKKNKKKEMKRLFIEFIERKERLPSQRSKDEKEKYLAKWLYRQKKNSLETYNSIVSLPNISSHLRKNKKEENKKLFIEFVEREERLPSTISKDKKERSLANWFYNHLKSHRDLEIYNSIVSLPNIASYLNKKKNKKEENKKLFIEFVEREERLPSNKSEDKKEKYLARWFYSLKKLVNLELYRELCIKIEALGIQKRESTLKIFFKDISIEDLSNLSVIELLSLVPIQKLPKEVKDKIRRSTGKEELKHVLSEIKEKLDSGALKEESQNEEKTVDEIIKEYKKETKEETETKLNESSLVCSDLARAFENIHSLSNLQEHFPAEKLDFLVCSKIQTLWNTVHRTEENAEDFIEKKLCESTSEFEKKILSGFLTEYLEARDLVLPEGWRFSVNGKNVNPTLMQKYTATMIRNRHQFGNWSETGTGKTISAILSSRIIDARITVVLCVNSTISTWKNQIHDSFTRSFIYTKEQISKNTILDRNFFNYVLINYEEFQNAEKYQNKWLPFIKNNHIDFVVIDEIQMIKRNEVKFSERRKVTENFLQDIDTLTYGRDLNIEGRKVPMLVMSATPVINSLNEGSSIISLLKGSETKRPRRFSTQSAYDLHYDICRNGIRIVEPEAASTILNIKTKIYEELPKTENIRTYNHLLSYNNSSEMCRRKLIECYRLGHLQKGVKTIIYSYLVNNNVVDDMADYLRLRGFNPGEFTGRNSDIRGNVLRDFIEGDIDVLIASSPITTGLDGLQKVCNRIILIVAPWTYAETHQLIGRLNRKGTNFEKVDVIFPMVYYSDKISVDNDKYLRIKYKSSLADVVMSGDIPETIISTTDIRKLAEEGLKELQELEKSGKVKGEAQISSVAPELTVKEHKKRVRGHRNKSDYFSSLQDFNQKAASSLTKNIWNNVIKNKEDWNTYHKLRETVDRGYLDIIAQEFLKSNRPKVLGDFGCGDNQFKHKVPKNYTVISVDKYAADPSVLECDLQDMHSIIQDSTIDVAVYALALWGKDWINTLKEGYRVLDYDGKIIICEPTDSSRLKKDKVVTAIRMLGFKDIKDFENFGDKYYYLTATK